MQIRYKIVKRVEAKSINEAIRKEKTARIIEVYEDVTDPTSSQVDISDKSIGFNKKAK